MEAHHPREAKHLFSPSQWICDRKAQLETLKTAKRELFDSLSDELRTKPDATSLLSRLFERAIGVATESLNQMSQMDKIIQALNDEIQRELEKNTQLQSQLLSSESLLMMNPYSVPPWEQTPTQETSLSTSDFKIGHKILDHQSSEPKNKDRSSFATNTSNSASSTLTSGSPKLSPFPSRPASPPRHFPPLVPPSSNGLFSVMPQQEEAKPTALKQTKTFPWSKEKEDKQREVAPEKDEPKLAPGAAKELMALFFDYFGAENDQWTIART